MSHAGRLSVGRFVGAMSAFVGVLDYARFANPERWSRSFGRELGVMEGDRWDVALIQHCGFWSQYDHLAERSLWPITSVATAEDVVRFGREHGLLRSEPRVGDLWIQYNPRVGGRFVRAGVIAAVVQRGWWTPQMSYDDLLCLEGDTGNSGEQRGGQVLRISRRACQWRGDVYLRWADADVDVAPNEVALPEAA